MSLPSTEANKMNLRPVIKSLNLLNFFLVATSLGFVYFFLLPRLESKGSFVPPLVKKKVVEKTTNGPTKTQSSSPLEYVAIADQNLFHPERRIPSEKSAEAALPKPEFVLYGILITSDLSVAYLEDKKAPVTTPGRGQRQTALKQGESLSGFNLMEIMADKVVLTRGSETLVVTLDDPKSPKKRETPVTVKPQPHPPGIPVPKPPPTSSPPPPPPMPGIPSGPGQVFPHRTPTSPSVSGSPSPRPMPPGFVIPTRP